MPTLRTLRTRQWTFTFDGWQLTVVPWLNWRRRAAVCIRLPEVSGTAASDHDIDGNPYPRFDLWAEPDRRFSAGLLRRPMGGWAEASVFASYVNEASCERLRWIFRRTIGLGPHEPGVLRNALAEAHADHRPSAVADLEYRLAALRWDPPDNSFYWAEPRLTRENLGPADRCTDVRRALRGLYGWQQPFQQLVEHLRGDYEPVDDPAWREIAEQLTLDRPTPSPGAAT